MTVNINKMLFMLQNVSFFGKLYLQTILSYLIALDWQINIVNLIY